MAPQSHIPLFDLTCAELSARLKRQMGKSLFHAAAIYREVFKKGGTVLTQTPEFLVTPALGAELTRRICFPDCRIQQAKEDDALKYTVRLTDGAIIESVIIPADNRTTLCVSSQAGCRMACRFCGTGSMGFRRHLRPGEIVWQVWAARFLLKRRIDNIVFMGMGEPFDNWPNVMQALHIICDQRGLDIAPRHMTLSTAGHADGIEKMGEANLPNLRLAVSLHAADNVLRSSLMPINRKYPLERLKTALKKVPLGKSGVIFFEYTLLAGVNDAVENADQVARYLCDIKRHIPIRINVIPYNPCHNLPYAAPSAEGVARFCERLSGHGLFVCRRRSRGRHIQAACGQLVNAPLE